VRGLPRGIGGVVVLYTFFETRAVSTVSRLQFLDDVAHCENGALAGNAFWDVHGILRTRESSVATLCVSVNYARDQFLFKMP
jgi:hypothetical protein